jgi:uncharacterized membrane protein
VQQLPFRHLLSLSWVFVYRRFRAETRQPVRTVFALYLAFIAAGIVLYLVVGLGHY